MKAGSRISCRLFDNEHIVIDGLAVVVVDRRRRDEKEFIDLDLCKESIALFKNLQDKLQTVVANGLFCCVLDIGGPMDLRLFGFQRE